VITQVNECQTAEVKLRFNAPSQPHAYVLSATHRKALASAKHWLGDALPTATVGK